MNEPAPERLDAFREDLRRVAAIGDPAERALEVVGIVEAAGATLGVSPVIVGGMAVYFWTADQAFLTRDIDVVMETSPPAQALLEALGFERVSDGRHWRLRDTDVLLEAPGSTLDAGVVVSRVRLSSGRVAGVLSLVDVLLDRLDEFQATGHRVVAQQIVVLLAQLNDRDAELLPRRARERRVAAALEAMQTIADKLSKGAAFPESDELHAIARGVLRAAYPDKDR